MQRLPDPAGPANPGALIFLTLFATALVPLWWLLQGFDFTWVQCEQAVQLAPNLLDGALCGAFSAGLIAGPLWMIAGAPRAKAVVEDETGIEWDRPRFAPSLVPAIVFGFPVLLGAALAATTPRAYGTRCEIQDFDLGGITRATYYWDGAVAGSCRDPALGTLLRNACSTSITHFGVEIALLALALACLAWVAVHWRRPVARLVVDERGIQIDGERTAYADLDAVEQTDDLLRFRRFDGSVREIPLWPAERGVAGLVALRVRPLLPRDPEDRPEARQKLAQLT